MKRSSLLKGVLSMKSTFISGFCVLILNYNSKYMEPKKEIKSIKIEPTVNKVIINKKIENILSPRLSLAERKKLNSKEVISNIVPVAPIKEVIIAPEKIEKKFPNPAQKKEKPKKEIKPPTPKKAKSHFFMYPDQRDGQRLTDYFIEKAKLLNNNEFLLLSQKYKDTAIKYRNMLYQMYVVEQLKNLEDTHPRLIEHRALASERNQLKLECEKYLK